MEISKVRRSYQITLPRNLRQKMKVNVGDYVEFVERNGLIILRPVDIVPANQPSSQSGKQHSVETDSERDFSLEMAMRGMEDESGPEYSISDIKEPWR